MTIILNSTEIKKCVQLNDKLIPIIEDGRITSVEMINQVPYSSLPKLNIKSSSGIGGFVRPIMSSNRREQKEVIKVIDCYTS